MIRLENKETDACSYFDEILRFKVNELDTILYIGWEIKGKVKVEWMQW